MLRSEWMKVRRSVVWLLAGVSPLLAAFAGWIGSREGTFEPTWMDLLVMMALLHALLFLPLLTGVYAALLCRFEHAGGGWKQLLALPVRRSHVYMTKLILVMLLLAFTQALFLAALVLVGAILGFEGPVPWSDLFRSLCGGWVACLPLAALQLAAAVAWQSFAAPLAVNVIFTLPNLLVVNSVKYGPWYPWAQPLLAMMPADPNSGGAFNVSDATLYGVIGGSFALFLAVGWLYFSRKAV